MRINIPVVVTVTFMAAATMAQEPQRLEFKGVYIGQAATELRAATTRFHCTIPPNKVPSDEYCAFDYGIKETIAGVPVTDVSALIFDGRVHGIRVRFKPQDFSIVAIALEEKYGKPASTNTEMVTIKGGATYENVTSHWVLGTGTIIVRRYASRIDQAIVAIDSPDILKLTDDRQKAAGKKGASDL